MVEEGVLVTEHGQLGDVLIGGLDRKYFLLRSRSSHRCLRFYRETSFSTYHIVCMGQAVLVGVEWDRQVSAREDSSFL